MHSLRARLIIYSIIFVFTTSCAILWISVYQSKKRGERDIESIRLLENTRVRNTLKGRVDIICSFIDAHYRRSMTPEEMLPLLEQIHDLTVNNDRRYFWIIDVGKHRQFLIPHFSQINSDTFRRQTDLLIQTVINATLEKGNGYCSINWPHEFNNTPGRPPIAKLCYAQLFRPFNWIIVSGQYIDDMNDIIAGRIEATNKEISAIILERVLFSGIILLACTLGIILFTTRVTRPINRLVTFTQETASGKKGCSERIVINSRDEIGKLATSFNSMLGRIEGMIATLEENGRRYRELVENVNSAIIRLDMDGRIIFINEFSLTFLQISPHDAIGRKISDILISPMNFASLLDPFHHATDTDRYYAENEIVTAKGERKWVAWSYRPIFDTHGTLKEILCVGNDISVRKKAEELSRLQHMKLIQTDKMVTLGNLVSGVAHEINNPNNFILLNAENLSDMWKDIVPVLDEHFKVNHSYTLAGLSYEEMRTEIPALIGGLTGGAQRIKKIVQSLKDFVRQDPEDLNQEVDLTEVVSGACIILSNLIKNSTENFRIMKEGTCFVVEGNFQRLEQVVINLLTNACEATLDKKKSITVTLTNKPDSPDVILEIRDHGVGIQTENMKYIMDPFFTTKRLSGGTGLGLAICYNIIKDHCGELKIESTPDELTCAIVTLQRMQKKLGVSDYD